MSDPSDSPEKDTTAPTAASESELSEEQLEQVAGGGAVIARAIARHNDAHALAEHGARPPAAPRSRAAPIAIGHRSSKRDGTIQIERRARRTRASPGSPRHWAREFVGAHDRIVERAHRKALRPWCSGMSSRVRRLHGGETERMDVSEPPPGARYTASSTMPAGA